MEIVSLELIKSEICLDKTFIGLRIKNELSLILYLRMYFVFSLDHSFFIYNDWFLECLLIYISHFVGPLWSVCPFYVSSFNYVAP